MERRGQSRDMLGIHQTSMNYIQPAPATQESPVRLPLAPLVAASADRRGNAVVPTRRGGSIFSPTQILDHPNHPPPHLRHQVTPAPPQILTQNEPNPDPDPAFGPSSSRAPSAHHQLSPPSPPTSASTAVVEAPNCSSNANTPAIIYRECLKNHAAGIGGHIVDGCGEFMATGVEGTPEALKCAACDCHRSFHRKEVKGEPPPPPPPQHPYIYHPNLHRPNPSHHHKHPARPTMMNFSRNPSGAAAESSSEDLNIFHSGGGGNAPERPESSKKRARTKFSQEQKDRMQEFAEKLDWRIQKQDDQEIEEFCRQVGVSRQVFKVWMHNNKQAMKRKQI